MAKHTMTDKMIGKNLKEIKWTMVQIRCDECKQEYLIGMKDNFYGEGDAIIPNCLHCNHEWKTDEYKGTWEGFKVLGMTTLSSFTGDGIKLD